MDRILIVGLALVAACAGASPRTAVAPESREQLADDRAQTSQLTVGPSFAWGGPEEHLGPLHLVVVSHDAEGRRVETDLGTYDAIETLPSATGELAHVRAESPDGSQHVVLVEVEGGVEARSYREGAPDDRQLIRRIRVPRGPVTYEATRE